MDENRLKAIVEAAIKPVLDQLNDSDTGLAAINRRLDNPDTGLAAINRRLDDPDAGLVSINRRLDDPDTGLAAINRRLDDPDAGLQRINDSLDANTEAVVELEKTVKGYADSYKINDTNVRKVEKRLEIIEEKESIQIPPELQLAPQADI